MLRSTVRCRYIWLFACCVAASSGCRTGGPLETIRHGMHEAKGDYFKKFDAFNDGVEIEKGHARQALMNQWHARW